MKNKIICNQTLKRTVIILIIFVMFFSSFPVHALGKEEIQQEKQVEEIQQNLIIKIRYITSM